jgi:hypothetical protein
VSVPVASISASTALMTTYLNEIEAACAVIYSLVDDVGTVRGDLDTVRSNLEAVRAAIQGASYSIGNHLGLLGQHVTDLGTIVSGIGGGGGVDSLTTVTHDALIAAGLQAAAQIVNLQADQATVDGLSASVQGEVNDLVDAVVGLQDAETDIDAQVTAILNEAGTAGRVVDLRTQVVAVNAANAGYEEDVMSIYQTIWEHVDSLLSHDCKANLVSVPILTVDSEGFYAAPSAGLVARVQGFLSADERVAPSVTIRAVSGALFLVEAEVRCEGKAKTGYVAATVNSEIEEIVKQVLKGRAFGDSLYLQQIYDAIKDAEIEGISNLTVHIDGPLAYVDVGGNLIVDNEHVVTRGTISSNLTA